MRRRQLVGLCLLQALLRISFAKDIAVVWAPEAVQSFGHINATITDRLVCSNRADVSVR